MIIVEHRGVWTILVMKRMLGGVIGALVILVLGLGVAIVRTAGGVTSTAPVSTDTTAPSGTGGPVSTPGTQTSGPVRASFQMPPKPAEFSDLPQLSMEEVEKLSKSVSNMGPGVPWVLQEGADAGKEIANDAQRAYFEEFLACWPDPPGTLQGEALTRQTVECFNPKSIEAAAKSRDPADVMLSLYALNVARPDLFTQCHNAAHKIGQIATVRVTQAYGLRLDLLRYLLSAARSGCMGGLVHGVLDAVGYMKLEPEKFATVVEACITNTSEGVGYCADAVGHAAWDAYGEMPKGARLCSYFPELAQRNECVEGILMRKYQQLEKQDPYYTGELTPEEVQPWMEEVAALCAQLPSKPFRNGLEDPRTGCWSGSTYLLYKPAFVWFGHKANYAEAEPGIMKIVAAVYATCRSFGPAGEKACLERSPSAIGHLADFDKAQAAKLCRLMPQAYVEQCIVNANSRIDAADDPL